jgi:hypothetical protein
MYSGFPGMSEIVIFTNDKNQIFEKKNFLRL